MAQEKFSFRKETKLKIKFLILFIFSFNIQSSSLVLDFNNLIVNNFEFTQKTETNSSTTESKGKIFRMENEIKIEITEPSKELYRIIENKTIPDSSFDMKNFLHFLLSGTISLTVTFLGLTTKLVNPSRLITVP